MSVSPAKATLDVPKPISRATGKPQSAKEFAFTSFPSGKLDPDAAKDCPIPWLAEASIRSLIKSGVKSYDEINAAFHSVDEDEAEFIKWFEKHDVESQYAKKAAINYVDCHKRKTESEKKK